MKLHVMFLGTEITDHLIRIPLQTRQPDWQDRIYTVDPAVIPIWHSCTACSRLKRNEEGYDLPPEATKLYEMRWNKRIEWLAFLQIFLKLWMKWKNSGEKLWRPYLNGSSK